MSAHRRASENDPTPASRPAPAESPIPRRLLFTGAAAGLAGAGVLAGAAPAQAAPTTDSWKLGGNSGVTSTGTNFLGTLNAGIPLIFKTKAETGSTVTEKMRLTAQGRLG
ncbi:MAG: hypothetical protein Q7T71_14975, partial [Herbiconiux sp.]|nr:hypothetical protein [Herbiconiux sp.]